MRSTIALAAGLIFATLRLQAQVTAPLRAGDIFDLRLSGVPQEYATDFALQYTIDQDGTVNVPFIGEVKAAGFRPAQLERVIQAKLVSDQIFIRPTVLINVAQGNRHVSIHGGVRAPQRLPWSPDLTLSSGVGDCGGLGDYSSGNGIRLIRDGKVIDVYNLKDIRKDPSRDPRLLPGDQVNVPE